MNRFAAALTLSILMSATVLTAQEQTPLTEKTYPAILRNLKTLPVDTHWDEIPWRPNFTEAILEARKKDKPILLWIMNGHPCGMT